MNARDNLIHGEVADEGFALGGVVAFAELILHDETSGIHGPKLR